MEIDSALNSTSENPVKNRVIATRINDIENQITPLEDNISNHSIRIGNNEQNIQNIRSYAEGKFDDYDKKIAVLAGNTTIDWDQVESNINIDIVVDSELKSDSAYPVQNRVIKQALDTKANIEDIPMKVSDLENDLNFLTQVPVPSISIDEQTNTIVIQDVNNNNSLFSDIVGKGLVGYMLLKR